MDKKSIPSKNTNIQIVPVNLIQSRSRSAKNKINIQIMRQKC